MPYINFTNPIIILVAVAVFVVTLLIGKKCRKSIILGVLLGAFLILLIAHCTEIMVIRNASDDVYRALITSIPIDFVFIFLSFLSYLWIDEIQAREEKKKSIDGSLNWLWEKV